MSRRGRRKRRGTFIGNAMFPIVEEGPPFERPASGTGAYALLALAGVGLTLLLALHG